MDSSSQIIYCEWLKSPNILEKKAARSLKSLNTITDFIAQKKKKYWKPSTLKVKDWKLSTFLRTFLNDIPY